MPKKLVEVAYSLWITLMSASSADVISALLVRKGCKIGPLDEDNDLLASKEEKLNHVMAIDLTVDVPEKEAADECTAKAWTFELVKDVLDATGVLYYSVILNADKGGSRWEEGNVKAPKPAEPIQMGPYR